MSGKPEDRNLNLEKYREYLRLLAQLHLDRLLHGKIDLSGVVQQTMLEAHQMLPMHQDQYPDHLTAWLRRILANNLADEIRKLKTGKRDVRRERSLEAALEQSSTRLEAWIAVEQSSPSAHLRRQEDAVRLSAALGKLPEAQREALVMRHFQGWSLARIAVQLGRSPVAAAGLIKRGLQQLRDQLPEER